MLSERRNKHTILTFFASDDPKKNTVVRSCPMLSLLIKVKELEGYDMAG
jgi:hypothetical protein